MRRALLVPIILATAAASPANAQLAETPSEPQVSTWRLDIGAATLVTPRYSGSDQTRVQAILYKEAAYRDLVLATVREGRARVDVTPPRTNGLYLGGEFSVLFPQDERDSRLPIGFGNVPATPDVGIVGGFETRAFQVGGRVRQAIAGHGGATAQLDASLRFPVPGTLKSGRPTIVSIGPQVNWGDRRYAQRLFGIDAGRAQRTGLRRYVPADAVTYGGSVALVQPLWKRLTLVGVSAVTRLTGDAARSPIVRQRTNYSAVIALVWRFQRR